MNVSYVCAIVVLIVIGLIWLHYYSSAKDGAKTIPVESCSNSVAEAVKAVEPEHAARGMSTPDDETKRALDIKKLHLEDSVFLYELNGPPYLAAGVSMSKVENVCLGADEPAQLVDAKDMFNAALTAELSHPRADDDAAHCYNTSELSTTADGYTVVGRQKVRPLRLPGEHSRRQVRTRETFSGGEQDIKEITADGTTVHSMRIDAKKNARGDITDIVTPGKPGYYNSLMCHNGICGAKYQSSLGTRNAGPYTARDSCSDRDILALMYAETIGLTTEYPETIAEVPICEYKQYYGGTVVAEPCIYGLNNANMAQMYN